MKPTAISYPMSAEITLSDNPRRQARISVGNGDNKLTWTFDAPGISDAAWQQLIADGINDSLPESVLMTESREARDFRDRIATVISTLKGAMNILERDHMLDGVDEESFLDFADRIIQEEKASGDSPSRVDKYRVAVSRLRQYLIGIGKEGILLRNLNAGIIDGFDNHLSADGLKESTRAFYNRILVAIYNRGVRMGLSADNSPFANVATQHREKPTSQPVRKVKRHHNRPGPATT